MINIILMPRSLQNKIIQKIICNSMLLAATVFINITKINASELTFQQKNELKTIIRNYLLKNPEILYEISDALLKKEKKDKRKHALASHADTLFHSKDDIVAGPSEANVTIVEFYNYFNTPGSYQIDDIKKLLAANKDLKIISRIVTPASDSKSRMIAKLVLAARREGVHKQLQFHQALFRSKLSYRDGEDKIRNVVLLQAKRVGLNIERLKKNAEAPSVLQALNRNNELNHALEIAGFPSYVLSSGVIIPGFAGFSALNTAVDVARKEKLR